MQWWYLKKTNVKMYSLNYCSPFYRKQAIEILWVVIGRLDDGVREGGGGGDIHIKHAHSLCDTF